MRGHWEQLNIVESTVWRQHERGEEEEVKNPLRLHVSPKRDSDSGLAYVLPKHWLASL